MFALVSGIGCNRREVVPPTTRPARATVASLVPAATDLLLDMGAGDHLVAVSTYDTARDGVTGLPRVGDYQTTDWEQIRALRPTVMVRQFAPDRVPPNLRERCEELGIRLVNLRIDKLDDIFAALDVLGDAAGEPAKAAAARNRLRGRLDAVRRRAAGRPRPSSLVFHGDAGDAVIGPGTFLDELLSVAGGTNAAAGLGQPYPTIDRETLRALDPDVILQLLPGATPQVSVRARQTWAGRGELKAVKAGRVYPFTDWYLLLPGAHVADVAERFADVLHGGGEMPVTATTGN